MGASLLAVAKSIYYGPQNRSLVACASREKLDFIEAYRATYFISANKQ